MTDEQLIKDLRGEFALTVREMCADDKFDCDDLCDGDISTAKCIVFQAADRLEALTTEIERLESICKIQKASCNLVKTVEAANLKDENAQLRAELDAAVADMSGICYLCGNAKPYRAGSPTMMTCKHMDCLATMKKPGCKFFKWRGAKGENDAEVH